MVPRGAKIACSVLVVLAILAGASFFVVSETQQVVITQFGRPGWAADHWGGTPFQGPVHPDGQLFRKAHNEMGRTSRPDSDQGQKIHLGGYHGALANKGPAAFPEAGWIDPTAQSRLDGIIDSVVRDHVSNNDLVELVRSEGWAEAKQKLGEAGIPESQVLGSGFETPEQTDHLQKGREKITREMVADASRLIPEFGMRTARHPHKTH